MRKIFLLLLISLSLPAFAEEKIGDVTQFGAHTYMLVNVFNTSERFDEFQKNVEILKREMAILKQTTTDLALAKTEADKIELQNKVKEQEDAMDNNDALMLKHYAFSTKRQYRFVFEETKLCTPLTEDEVTNLKNSEGKELDAEKIIEKDGKAFYIAKEISGIKENEKFQRAINFPMMRAQEIAALRKSLKEETDIFKKAEISEKIAKAEKAMQEAQELLRKEYNLDSSKSCSMKVEKVKLYLLLTPEEVIKLQAEKKI